MDRFCLVMPACSDRARWYWVRCPWETMRWITPAVDSTPTKSVLRLKRKLWIQSAQMGWYSRLAYWVYAPIEMDNMVISIP